VSFRCGLIATPGGVTLMSVTPSQTDHPEVDVEDPR